LDHSQSSKVDCTSVRACYVIVKCAVGHRVVLFKHAEDKYSMTRKYLIAKAHNTVTGQNIMMRDLNGAKIDVLQRKLAEEFAQKYADKLTKRTGDLWTASVVEYTPGTVTA
jgi:hypothetical protein